MTKWLSEVLVNMHTASDITRRTAPSAAQRCGALSLSHPGPLTWVRIDGAARSLQRGSGILPLPRSVMSPPELTTWALTCLLPHQLVHVQATERTPLPAEPSGSSPSRATLV